MNLTKKLILGGAGLVALAAIPIGINYLRRIVMTSGHDEPLTVDNPKIVIDFNKDSHPMHVDRDGFQAVRLHRDVTTLDYASATYRNSPDPQVLKDLDKSSPILLIDSGGGQIAISITPPQQGEKHDQVNFGLSRQFGGCWLHPIVNNKCGSADDGLRLLAVQYRTSSEERYVCFDTGEHSPSHRCQVSNPDGKAALTLHFTPDPKK
ncbi:MAG: hypothetical protein U0R19_09965 [Bryobacteraceae bacterium]